MSNYQKTIIEILNHILINHSEMKTIASSAIDIKYNNFLEWSKADFSSPSPHFIKQAVLKRNGIPNAKWIETGTYLGETTQFLSEFAEYVYTIEPMNDLYNAASKKFESNTNVKCINGLSEDVLPSILKDINGNLNLWLDGHYSAGITFKGPLDTPILIELEAINRYINNFDRICIFIDDIRCFDPNIKEYSAYPSLNTLIEWANNNHLKWIIEHDILIMRK